MRSRWFLPVHSKAAGPQRDESNVTEIRACKPEMNADQNNLMLVTATFALVTVSDVVHCIDGNLGISVDLYGGQSRVQFINFVNMP